jgi:hypothetical protein
MEKRAMKSLIRLIVSFSVFFFLRVFATESILFLRLLNIPAGDQIVAIGKMKRGATQTGKSCGWNTGTQMS